MKSSEETVHVIRIAQIQTATDHNDTTDRALRGILLIALRPCTVHITIPMSEREKNGSPECLTSGVSHGHGAQRGFKFQVRRLQNLCSESKLSRLPISYPTGWGRGRGQQESTGVDRYLGFFSFALESIINDLYDPSLNAS